MKLVSFRSAPSFLSLVLLVVAGLTTPMPAASADKPNDKQSDEQRRDQWTFTIDFPGGTIAQLVKAVSNSSGPAFNVIGEKADLATELPPFSLRNADSESLANALNQLLQSRGLNVTRASGPNIVGERGQLNIPIYALIRRASFDPIVSDSFQLAPYLEKQSIDDIVVAIRTLWELNPANRPEALQLKFHPQTKLLLVSGTPAAIQVASKVISTLSGGSEKSARSPEDQMKIDAETARRRALQEQMTDQVKKEQNNPKR